MATVWAMTTDARRSRWGELAIWVWAFGYFAAYAPYSAMTKAVTGGLLEGRPLGGLEILPITTMASLVGMLTFLSVMGWWKDARHKELAGLRVPLPTWWTFLSGLCTAAIIGTTTLAYTFDGTSIVMMMLLMRGGVLIIAPMVDALSRRHVRWFSWAALGLSLLAVVIATLNRPDLRITWVAALDVAVYLGGYFVRLRFMSHLAKSDDPKAQRRYFVEEQMVATPAIVLFLAALALWGGSDAMLELRKGFTTTFASGRVLELVVIGLLSQGTGVFGGLILLDKRENSFCVPVNRASSILAGVVAGFGLWMFFGASFPGTRELLGAALVIGAISFLSVPPLLQARARRAQAAAERSATHLTPG